MLKHVLRYVFQKYKSVKIANKLFVVISCVVIFIISFAGYFFYLKTSELMINSANTQMAETIKQTTLYINEKLAFVLQQFTQIEADGDFKSIAANKTKKDYTSDFVLLASKFEKIRTQNNSMIDNIFFYRYDQKEFYEYTSILNKDLKVESTDWNKVAINNEYKLLWYKTHVSDIFKNLEGKRVFSLVSEISDDYFAPKGILVFDLQEKFLKNYLQSVNLGTGSVLFVVDKDKNVIADSLNDEGKSSGASYIDAAFSHKNDKGFFEMSTNKARNVVIYDTIAVSDYKVIAVIPKENLSKSSEIVKQSVIYIVLISVMLFATIVVFVIYAITKPISKLVGFMKVVETGELDVRIPAPGTDEMGVLEQAFNRMLDSIQELIITVDEEREMKMGAELRALQEQINSHFLYNTLDSIYWMGHRGDGENAAEMAAELANFIRLGLNKGSDITTVGREIEHIKSYMKIQKIRYDDILDYSIDVEESISGCIIPKLIIQPLVENAILHGLEEKKGMGLIQIKGSQEGERVILEVIDDGIGLDVEKINEQIKYFKQQKFNAKQGGYALYNVYNRIKMRYHDQGTIDFFNNPTGGARVVISLPFKAESD